MSVSRSGHSAAAHVAPGGRESGASGPVPTGTVRRLRGRISGRHAARRSRAVRGRSRHGASPRPPDPSSERQGVPQGPTPITWETTVPPDRRRFGSAAVYRCLRSVRSARNAAGSRTRRGPSGSLESRTPTPSGSAPSSTHSPPWSLLRRALCQVTTSMICCRSASEGLLLFEFGEQCAERGRGKKQLWSFRVLRVSHTHALGECCQLHTRATLVIAAPSFPPHCHIVVHRSEITFRMNSREASVLNAWPCSIENALTMCKISSRSLEVTPPVDVSW